LLTDFRLLIACTVDNLGQDQDRPAPAEGVIRTAMTVACDRNFARRLVRLCLADRSRPPSKTAARKIRGRRSFAQPYLAVLPSSDGSEQPHNDKPCPRA